MVGAFADLVQEEIPMDEIAGRLELIDPSAHLGCEGSFPRPPDPFPIPFIIPVRHAIIFTRRPVDFGASYQELVTRNLVFPLR